MTEKTITPINTYLVAVQSNFVKEAKVLSEEGERFERSIEDVSVVLGPTFEADETAAIKKMSVNHNIPESLLTAYQIIS